VAYGSADATGGSGFLAVYLAGLVLNEGDIPARQTMTVFHDGLAWLAQVALFLTLGLLVSPAGLGEVWREGVLLALVLMLVARPVAVTVALSHDAYSLSERAVLAWAGLRGAVPVVLATFAVTAGIAGSSRFFDIVFFTVVLSTLLQGTTFEPLARHLGLTAIAPSLPRPLADRATIRGLGAVVLEYGVGPGDGIVGRRIRDLGLPDGATVTVVVRGREALPPHGDTRVSAGDVLHLLAREEARAETTALFDGWGESTWEPRRTVAHPVLEKESLAAGAWGSDDGDPADPELVGGIAVVGRLRARADVAGALVALEDGRYAVTGASSVVGSLDGLRRYAHRRFETARNDSERSWWREVLGALGS
jgi:potassium/hydrogen antiporter